jgi:uncharacterized beta-barrel protein YwiB (DUF1934 family)
MRGVDERVIERLNQYIRGNDVETTNSEALMHWCRKIGEMDMEVFTTRVKNALSEEGTGSVEVDYDVSIGGMAEGKNELRIEVK